MAAASALDALAAMPPGPAAPAGGAVPVAGAAPGVGLNAGALLEVCRRGRGHPGWDFQPTLQVIDMRSMAFGGHGGQKMMLVLSDSQYFVLAVATAEVEARMQEPGGVDLNSFVQLVAWQVDADRLRQQKHIILTVHELRHVARCPEQYGKPESIPLQLVDFGTPASAPVAPQQHHQQPPPQQHFQQQPQPAHQYFQQQPQPAQQHFQQQPPPQQQHFQQTPQQLQPPQQRELPPTHWPPQQQQQQQQQQQPPWQQTPAQVTLPPSAESAPPSAAHAAGAPFGAARVDRAPAPQRSGSFSGGGPGGGPALEKTLISQITPYRSGRWFLQARVTTKSDVRKFSNARGEGQLFKVDLMDCSGEISATFFGKAVDKFYAALQQGRVYRFSGATIKNGNPRFDSSPVVLTFDERANIDEVQDDSEVPRMAFSFKHLSEVQEATDNAYVDLAAIVFCIQDSNTFNSSKTGKELTKREVALWDPSGADGTTVTLTLWGQSALNVPFEEGAVVFIKGAQVREWQGVKGLSSPGFMQAVDPSSDSTAAHLQAAFEERQRTRPLAPHPRSGAPGFSSEPKTISAIRDEDVELAPPPMPGQPLDPNGPKTVHRHVVIARATGIQLDRTPCYPSCPELVDRGGAQAGGEKRACNKKVTEQGFECFTCAAGHQCRQPVWRYMIRLKFTDHTDSIEVSFFDEHAKKLFGIDAAEYNQAWERSKNQGDEEELERLNSRVLWRPICLKMRAQKEVWQDEERVKYSATEANPIESEVAGRRQLAEVLCSVAAPGGN